MRLHPDVTKENYPTNYNSMLKSMGELPDKITNIHGNKYSLKFAKYKTNNTDIRVYCKECGKFFFIKPFNLKLGTGCKRCYERRRLKSQKQYIEELSLKNKYVECVGIYKGISVKICHRCLICSKISKVLPGDKLKGYRNMCCKPENHNHLMDSPAMLYIFKIIKNGKKAYKVGITTKNKVLGGNQSRYPYKDDIDSISELEVKVYNTMREAYEMEQNIIKKYGKFLYTGEPLLKSGNTELFKIRPKIS